MHFLRAFTTENGLQWGLRITEIMFLVPKLNGRDLQRVPGPEKIKDKKKQGVVVLQSRPGPPRQPLFHPPENPLPPPKPQKILKKKAPATKQVFPQSYHF